MVCRRGRHLPEDQPKEQGNRVRFKSIQFQAGRETQLLRLGQIAGNGIILKVAEMGSHQCVIIPVGTDVKGVEVTEIHELPDRSLKSAWFGRYHRISLQTIAHKGISPFSLGL